MRKPAALVTLALIFLVAPVFAQYQRPATPVTATPTVSATAAHHATASPAPVKSASKPLTKPAVTPAPTAPEKLQTLNVIRRPTIKHSVGAPRGPRTWAERMRMRQRATADNRSRNRTAPAPRRITVPESPVRTVPWTQRTLSAAAASMPIAARNNSAPFATPDELVKKTAVQASGQTTQHPLVLSEKAALTPKNPKPAQAKPLKKNFEENNPVQPSFGTVLTAAGFLAKLGFVLLLAYLSVVALKLFWSRAGRPLKFGERVLMVEESAPLSAGSAVHVVRLNNQRYLVGTAQGQVTILASVDDADISEGKTASVPPDSASAIDSISALIGRIKTIGEPVLQPVPKASRTAPASGVAAEMRKSAQFIEELRGRMIPPRDDN